MVIKYLGISARLLIVMGKSRIIMIKETGKNRHKKRGFPHREAPSN
jgi:hypothetical protein